MNYFAHNIKYLRNKNGLKQAEIALLIGIPRTTYSSYEDDSAEPNLERLLVISDFFGIDLGIMIKQDVQVIDQNGGLEKLVKSTGNSTAISTGNREKKGILKEESPPYGSPKTIQNNQEITTALRHVIKTQESLIASLNTTISMLNERVKQLENKG